MNKDYSTFFFGKKILSELPPDSILFSNYMWFPLLYLQQIENRRPDLTFILQAEAFLSGYFEPISKERFPNINHIDLSNNHYNTKFEHFWKLSYLNVPNHHLFWEPSGYFQNYVLEYITPNGILFSFDPRNKNKISSLDIRKANEYLESLIKYDLMFIKNSEGKTYLANLTNFIANFWSKLDNDNQVIKALDAAMNISPEENSTNSNYGTYLMSKGHMAASLTHLQKLYEISPYDLNTHRNLAKFMLLTNQYQNSLYLLTHFMNSQKHRDQDVELLLAVTYYELKNYGDSIKFLDKASDTINRKLSIEINSTKYEDDLKQMTLYRELAFEGMMNND